MARAIAERRPHKKLKEIKARVTGVAARAKAAARLQKLLET